MIKASTPNKKARLQIMHLKASHALSDNGNATSTKIHLLVRAARPASVIWWASRLSDLRDDRADDFLKPLSVTAVKDRFILSRFAKPARKDESKI